MSEPATVRERPILFSKQMILALLSGAKTQTRRAIKCPQWFEGHLLHAKNEHGGYDVMSDHEGGEQMFCPYGKPGYQLWVKETHCLVADPGAEPSEYRGTHRGECVVVDYYASGPHTRIMDRIPKGSANARRWRPSIFMPKWASRITLEIESVRVERLQEISDMDALAEGVTIRTDAHIASEYVHGAVSPAQFEYFALWEAINGRGSWDKNPWVWVLTFRKL